MKRIAVLGAGVAGLTAADELSRCGYQVDIYERRDQLGGKARSFQAPVNGLGRLPAEHGFRFFPGFYWHLPETMKNIPYGRDSKVYKNLKDAHDIALLRTDKTPVIMPTSDWGFLHPDEVWIRLTEKPLKDNFGLKTEELTFLAGRLWDLLCTCRERRLAENEVKGWLEYCGAMDPTRGGEYKTMMLAMTRSLVAARADEMSARTGGDILLQLQLAWVKPGAHPDRLLNGPTSEVWIDPWEQKLRATNLVQFYREREVVGFDVDGPHLTAVRLKDTASGSDVEPLTGYDWYVCALPVEIMTKLVGDDFKEAAPSLANLDNLKTRWMNGFMLYLKKDDSMVHGHSIYVDSPWALTSVSQAQFWRPDHLDWKKTNAVGGIISIDISDWETPGRYVGKAAKYCTPEEIQQEVLGEMRDHSQEAPWERSLDAKNIAGFFIDDDIYRPNPGGAAVNLEPLFINTTGSWASRPSSETEVDNLVLAADYVRTSTDLATMEGANEAARRAVNHILDQDGSECGRCELRAPEEPAPFSLLRHHDRDHFRKHHRRAYEHAHEMLAALGIEHEREHREGSTVR